MALASASSSGCRRRPGGAAPVAVGGSGGGGGAAALRRRVRAASPHVLVRAAAAAATSASLSAMNGGRGPLVVIDNYDSFTYNLCQYLGDLGVDLHVIKNDELTVDQVRALGPCGVLVSPGPGCPIDSGISLQAVRELGPDFPLFGVCMGHQCIGEAFGGKVVRAPCGVMHGKTSPVHHTGVGLLEGLDNPFLAARYHSLAIERASIPEGELEVTAWTDDGTIMAVRHRRFPLVQGVQFHPESIITQDGKRIVANFVRSMGLPVDEAAVARGAGLKAAAAGRAG